MVIVLYLNVVGGAEVHRIINHGGYYLSILLALVEKCSYEDYPTIDAIGDA